MSAATRPGIPAPTFSTRTRANISPPGSSNKRSISIDLRSTEGRAVFDRLVATSEVVVNNLRGDLPAKMGLDYSGLVANNPSVACMRTSAYGRDNPRADWPGYDYLAQAESGPMHMTGEPDGPPS